MWRRASFAIVFVLLCLSAGDSRAADISRHAEYTLQGQVYLRSESNPFRFSESRSDEKESDTSLHRALRGGLIVPLLSDQTRLSISGTLGQTRYADYKQLNHNPTRLDTALNWQAGELFAGSFAYSYDKRLYRYLNRTWPERDMVGTHTMRAEVGLRVSNDLTLPLVTLVDSSVDYDYGLHDMLYDRDVSRIQLAMQYRGTERSVVLAGVRQTTGKYPDRDDYWAGLIDRSYTDREIFADWQWKYSSRTALSGTLGYQRRSYPTLTDRNADLFSALLHARWQYSAKTDFDIGVWRRPYPNDEDPSVLYGTVTGAQLTVSWAHSEKLWTSLNLVRERMVDTTGLGTGAGAVSYALRIGPRVEWQAHRNIRLVLDGWHDRTRGRNAGATYINNVVRIGMIFSFDNGSPRPAQLLWNPECDAPRYLETLACQPM